MLKELNGDDLCTIPKGSSKVCQICWSALEVFVHMRWLSVSLLNLIGHWSDPVMRCYSMFIVPSKSCSWPLGGRFLTSLCLDDTTFISPGLDPLEWKEIGLFFLKYNSHTHFMLHNFSSARCSYSHNDPLSTTHFFKSRGSSMTAVYKGILTRQALIQHI